MSDFCLGVAKNASFKENNAFSLVWPCPSTRTPASGVMKFPWSLSLYNHLSDL